MFEIIPNWHPIFVHFTVAMFSVSTLFYLLSHLTSNTGHQDQWRTVAKWNLWLGAAISVFTVVAGWQAYNTVDHDTPSHLAMTDHRNWAMVTFVFFLLLAAWSFRLDKSGKTKNWLFVALMVISTGVLASTAWRGGEVVFRYGLGVMSLPKVEGEGHQHEHGDGGGHGPAGHHDSLDNAEDAATGKQSMPLEQGDHGHDGDARHEDHGEPGHHDQKKKSAGEIDNKVNTKDHHDDHGEPGHHDNDKEPAGKKQEKADHHDDGHEHAH